MKGPTAKDASSIGDTISIIAVLSGFIPEGALANAPVTLGISMGNSALRRDNLQRIGTLLKGLKVGKVRFLLGCSLSGDRKSVV